VFRLTRTKGYRPVYKQEVKRNEPLDCKVYAYAAARLVRNSIPSDHPLYENICKLWYPDE
jgi:phage terminase large subunit GpA-like protein